MKSDCSIIDSDSDSCCSSNYEEEHDVEYDMEEKDNEHKERKDNDKGKEHNQHEDNLDNDGDKWNEEPMIEDNVDSFNEDDHHAKRTTLQSQISIAEPHSVLKTGASLANVEMQHDSAIATGQHHIWI